MRAGSLACALLALVLVAPAPSAAQEVVAAVAPDTVRVGDVFRAAVRVDLPQGYEAVFPDSLPLGEDVEAAGRPGRRVEELPDGVRRMTVVYPLSAWRPGPTRLPVVAVRLRGPDGERTVEAALPRLVVRSVLPADTAGLEPRGPKDVLGASRAFWPLVLALLGGVVAVGGLIYWRRRGPVDASELAPPLPPRERALAALDRARELGLVEAGRYKRFYSLVSGALRAYLDESNSEWGAELTSTELVQRVERRLPDDAVATLERLLHAADTVKFARRRPSAEEALSDWASARAWVVAHGWPPAAGAAEPEPAGTGQEVA